MSAAGFWTTEKVEGLKRLWVTSASLSEIARELGCSRGAVSGKGKTEKLGNRGSQVARGKIVSARTERRMRQLTTPPKTKAKSVVARATTHGSARNPGFNYFTAPKMTKSEMMAMLKAAVENTK